MRVFFHPGMLGRTAMMPMALVALSYSVQALVPVSESALPEIAEESGAAVEPANDLPSISTPDLDALTLFPSPGDLVASGRFGNQRFGYLLHGEARASYESNLFIQPQGAQDDFIFRLSPGITMGMGDFRGELDESSRFQHRFEWALGKSFLYTDYTPSYTWYARHSDQDGFDQDARIVGEWTVNRLILGMRARYFTQNVPEEDLGTRVQEHRLAAAVTASYQVTAKTNLETELSLDSVDYDGEFVDTREWRNEEWMNYQLASNLRIGAGVALGYVDRSIGAVQTYEEALARLEYKVAEGLALELTGGFQERQVEGSGDHGDGVFQFDLAWIPAAGVAFDLQAFRKEIAAGTIGDDYYTATGVQLQVRQRVFRSFFWSLAAGYQNADYETSSASVDAGRVDDWYFIRPGVGFDLARWVNCEVSGEYRHNHSTIDARSFDSTSAMVRINVVF